MKINAIRTSGWMHLAAVLYLGGMLLVGCGDQTAPITDQTAREIALSHAGLSAEEVRFIQVKLEKDGGRTVYEIEFVTDAAEYDYEIDAITGEITAFDYDAETQSQPVADLLTEEAAREIALSHAGLSAEEVRFGKVKLEKEDGRQIYEIEFFRENTEYDVEIDAVTGEILVYDYEVKAASSSNLITEEEAREIALSHVGFSADSVRFDKVELDRDDGVAVYEIEFLKDSTEYDFEINAATGDIISYRMERQGR